jgi:hypothetical protein
MDFPASRLIGKCVHVVLRCSEEIGDRQRPVTIPEATINEVHGDWMLVEPANWTGHAWVNLNQILYLDLYKGE